MGEEVLVLGGENRFTNNGRDVLILGDLPVLPYLTERLAVGIVNVADRRKLEAGEWSYIRQVGSVKIDVMKSCRSKTRRDNRC
jgi:hypothetical protein